MANYTDPAQATSLFQSWGWQGNITRAFGMPDGVSPEDSQINGVYISVHRFTNPMSAVAALDYSLVDQASSGEVYEVEATPVGDYSRALYGRMSYGNEITLLSQRGDLFLRVSVAQLEGEPTGFATALLQSMLAKVE